MLKTDLNNYAKPNSQATQTVAKFGRGLSRRKTWMTYVGQLPSANRLGYLISFPLRERIRAHKAVLYRCHSCLHLIDFIPEFHIYKLLILHKK